jgi:hypothetical protein
METGTIIRSTHFHKTPYWVVKCDNSNLSGNRNGELPIDEQFLDDFYRREGTKIKFELVELGNIENYKWYARILS